MYGRSSVNSVGGAGGGAPAGSTMATGGADRRARAQSLRSSIGGSSAAAVGDSSSSLSSVETGPRSDRDVRGSTSSIASSSSTSTTTARTSGGHSSVDSYGSSYRQSPSSAGGGSYDQNVLKARASVLSQLGSVFGQLKPNTGFNQGCSRRRSIQVYRDPDWQVVCFKCCACENFAQSLKSALSKQPGNEVYGYPKTTSRKPLIELPSVRNCPARLAFKECAVLLVCWSVLALLLLLNCPVCGMRHRQQLLRSRTLRMELPSFIALGRERCFI